MRLRFAIRDLPWLAVVVALAVGWWMDRSRLANRHFSIVSEPGGTRIILQDNESGETWERRGPEWVPRY